MNGRDGDTGTPGPGAEAITAMTRAIEDAIVGQWWGDHNWRISVPDALTYLHVSVTDDESGGEPVQAFIASLIAALTTAWPLLEAQAAATERARIYAADNFTGDGSVGPDEIPGEYRHRDAAYWHRRWLFVMNQLDRAPTVWDVHYATATERKRCAQIAEVEGNWETTAPAAAATAKRIADLIRRGGS